MFNIPFSVKLAATRFYYSMGGFGIHRAAIMASQELTAKPESPVKVYSSIADLVESARKLRWTEDPWGGKLDAIKHPTFMQESIDSHPDFSGDCLPKGTLLLTEGHKFVPIEEVQVGTKIWGLDKWTTVQNVWSKGDLPVDVVHLNNGSSFKATEEHKLFVALCKWHPVVQGNGRPCSCRMEDRVVKRISVAEAVPGMVLLTPDKIEEGTQVQSPEVAYVEGLFLSDGWCSHDNDFDIAGKDGHPKEEQKRAVQTICEGLGIETVWFTKSIRVKNKEWANRLHQMGGHAPEKHALSIDLSLDAAKALLEGIMADSGKNSCGKGRTFTTTSRLLALQTRVLHKMLGTSCGESYIVDHGGLGTNPIWRLNAREGGKKLLRIKHIDRDVVSLPVYDITTEDHYVYLPEADVTVSNCDDYANYFTCALRKGKLAESVHMGFALWEHKGELTGHMVCIFLKEGSWWWMSNWHDCTPQRIESMYGWMDAMQSEIKKKVLVAGRLLIDGIHGDDTVDIGSVVRCR